MPLTPKRRETIEQTIKALHAAENEAEQIQAALNKGDAKFENTLCSFPYCNNRMVSRDLERFANAVKRHEYCDERWRERVDGMLADWQLLRRSAREAWNKAKELEATLDGFLSEVMDAYREAFNERVAAMQKHLTQVYEPLLESREDWEKQQQFEMLLLHTPRYQSLLLIGGYARQGKSVASQISSLLQAITQLERREKDDLAAMQPK
jgi:hypothetical protein